VEHADVDGIQLEYEVTGAGDPVLLIHGAFVADSFRPFLAEPKLAGDYRLITYRRRGYGGSGGSIDRSPVSAERQAADCAGLLRWLGLQRAHIVGHSFGGCVALQLALDSPQLVRTLAVLEPALFVGPSAQSCATFSRWAFSGSHATAVTAWVTAMASAVGPMTSYDGFALSCGETTTGDRCGTCYRIDAGSRGTSR
jgi:pimeloyl-ACP methyl ester carboxylesterase